MPGDDYETKPISLFYSYSHKDEDLRLKLRDHLAALKWSGMIAEWNDRDIEAGKEWEKEIDHHLSSADIILLLVSASFIASEYCRSVEIKKALERHDRGEARVIPVILKPCQWQRTPFARLQATPKDAKPVTQWRDWDTAFHDVVSKIEAVVDELQRNVGKAAGPAAHGVEIKAVKLVPRRRAPPPRVFADFTVFRDIDAPWCPEMVALPAGEFLMGSPLSEKGRPNRERPQHRVTIGSRFAIGRHPVTVRQYRQFVEATYRRHDGGLDVWTGAEWKNDPSKIWSDPGFTQTDRHPVVGVNWHDAQAYCEWLAKETGKPYRLPWEAEWEYACRAGTATPFSFGETITEKDANFGMNVRKTTEVGSFPPSPWGLCDMHGNVWEWCADGRRDYTTEAVTDPVGPTEAGARRVLRGGSWNFSAQVVRSAYRLAFGPGYRDSGIGFRCARAGIGFRCARVQS